MRERFHVLFVAYDITQSFLSRLRTTIVCVRVRVCTEKCVRMTEDRIINVLKRPRDKCMCNIISAPGEERNNWSIKTVLQYREGLINIHAFIRSTTIGEREGDDADPRSDCSINGMSDSFGREKKNPDGQIAFTSARVLSDRTRRYTFVVRVYYNVIICV